MAVIIILRLLSSDVMVEDVEDGHFWLLTDDCVTNVRNILYLWSTVRRYPFSVSCCFTATTAPSFPPI